MDQPGILKTPGYGPEWYPSDRAVDYERDHRSATTHSDVRALSVFANRCRKGIVMSDVVLLDGATSQALVRRTNVPAHPLWGAHVMLEEPEALVGLHAEYLAAGARVLTLNTYSLTPFRLNREGAGEHLGEWTALAGRLAREAIEQAGSDAMIAGSVSPLVGSYRPDLAPPFEDALNQYRQIAEAQFDHVDLFLVETMGSGDEARAAVTALAEIGKPIWVAFSLQDEGSRFLRGGETLAQAVAALDGLDISAVLVNCCHPESVDAAIEDLSALGRPFGAYANGFQSMSKIVPGATIDLDARNDLTPDVYARTALDWVAHGARIVGGCCDIGPEHITALRDRLRNDGHALVGGLS